MSRVRTPARRAPTEAAWALGAGLLALICAALVLDLGSADLHVPISALGGDATNAYMAVKMLAGGSWFHNELIGAPNGASLRDYPFYWDLGQALGIKGIALFVSDPAAVFNLAYVLSYPAIAFSAHLTLRWCGARRESAVVGAVLFAVLPYHFIRGTGHFFIGLYWAVPFAAALVFKLAAGQPLLVRRAGDERRLAGWLTAPTLLTLAAAVLSGIQFGYYAIFTLILVALVAVVRLFSARGVRSLLEPAVVLAVCGAGFVVMLLPTLLYRASHGTDPLVGNRVPLEAELFGLKLSQLLLPIQGHRIPAFAHKAAEYAATAPQLGEGPSTPALGLLLGGAFAGSVLVLIAGAFRGPAITAHGQALRAAGLCGLLSLLLGTIGGGSSVFAYLVSSQLRGWGRIAVMIAFFAAVALTVVLDSRLLARRRIVALPILLIIGTLGVLDQTTPGFRPSYRTVLAAWRSDGHFVHRIEAEVAPHAMILQLPYIGFPETPPRAQATDYDLFRGTIHSATLRWSYGAIKQRPGDWGELTLLNQPLGRVVPEAAAAGFAGIYVDRFEYGDNGAAVLAQLSALTGAQPQLSEDGRLAFFALGPTALSLRATCPPAALRATGDALIHPTLPRWGAGFHTVDTDGRETWRFADPRAVVDFAPPPGAPAAPAQALFQLRSATGIPLAIQITTSGGYRHTWRVPPDASPHVAVPLPAGHARITFTTSGANGPAPAQQLPWRVVDLGIDQAHPCGRP